MTQRANFMWKLENFVMAVALFFSLLPLAGHDTGRHRWAMLSDAPASAAASLVVAAIAWAAYAALRRRQRDDNDRRSL